MENEITKEIDGEKHVDITSVSSELANQISKDLDLSEDEFTTLRDSIESRLSSGGSFKLEDKHIPVESTVIPNINYYMDHDIDEDEVNSLLKRERKDGSYEFSMEVAKYFLESYKSDTEWEWPQLISRYMETPERRDVIDQVFVDLCGWSLAKLIEHGVESVPE